MDFTAGEDIQEAQLIQRARGKDAQAWELLTRLHQAAVFRLAYLFLGDAAAAEDVTQETFLRAYYALQRFDASRALRPWLFSIAANLARNQRRSASRYLAAVTRLLREQPSALNQVEERTMRQIEANELWQAVRRLPLPDQQVIYLRFFLDLDTEETAQALNVAQGTVKSRLHRALGRLKQVILREFPSLQGGIE